MNKKTNRNNELKFSAPAYGYYESLDPHSSAYSGILLKKNHTAGNDDEGGFFSTIGDFFSNVGGDIANVYRTINRDIDKNDKEIAEKKLGTAREEFEDLSRLNDYYSLLQRKRDIQLAISQNEGGGPQYRSLIGQLSEVQSKISELDDYFLTEGRNHRKISEIMFSEKNLDIPTQVDLANKEAGEIFDPLRDFVSSTINSIRQRENPILAEKKFELNAISAAGGTILNGVELLANNLWNGLSRPFQDHSLEDSATTRYIRYAKDGDPIIQQSYIGERISLPKNKLDEYIADAKHEVEEGVKDVNDAQEAILSGRMLGIDNMYDYNKVPEEWRSGRDDYQQNAGFFDAFAHPFYATADIASSIDMMRYSIYAGLYDAGTRGLMHYVVPLLGKKAPYVGWVLTAADVAAGIGSVAKSREEETALEAAGAIQARVLKEAKDANLDLDQITQAIKQDAEELGISTKDLSDDELIELGILINSDTGVLEFENIKRRSRSGLNKLINSNNALAASDYLLTIPYMSYFGDALKAVKFGKGVSLANFNEGIDHIIEKNVGKAAKKFIGKDAPKAYLHAAHFAEYAAKKTKTIAGTSLLEAGEEGQQQIMLIKFERGDYDDYNKDYRTFDIGEIAGNLNLGKDAILAYLGISEFSDKDENAIRTAMNIGFWSSVIQSQGLHALTNIRGGSEDNIRGLVQQYKNDNLAVRTFTDFLKKQQDALHIEMFYERFRRGATAESLLKSLNDMKDYLSPYQEEPTVKYKDLDGKEKETTLSNAKRILTDREFVDATGKTKDQFVDPRTSLVKQEYIDGDIRLMLNAWLLYNDKDFTKLLKDEKIKKNSLAYKQAIIDGATSLADFQEAESRVADGLEDVNARRGVRKKMIQLLLNDELSDEERQELITSNPKLAKTALFLKKMYSDYKNKYLKDRNTSLKKTFENIFNITQALDQTSDEDIISFANSLSERQFTKNDVEEAKEFIKNNESFQDDEDRIGFDEFKEQFYSFYERKGYIEELSKNKKKFINNKYILDQIDDALGNRREILSRIFDKGGEKKDDLIKKAAEKGAKLISQEDFVSNQLGKIENWKARKMLLRQLAWVDDEAKALSIIRKLTGLDIDTSRIKGWVDYYKESLDKLHKTEKEFLGFGKDFDSVFNEDDVAFDDEEEMNAAIRDFYINSALKNAISNVANAYLTLNTSPDLLSRAIFGKDSGNNIFSIFIDEEGKLKEKIKARRESLERIGEDDESFADRADLAEVRKSAAVALIKHRIKEAMRRRKITHRALDDERNARVESVIRETLQQDDDTAPVETSLLEIPETEQERYLRKVFAWEEYKEAKKKREERRRRKAERKKNKEERENEESGKNEPNSRKSSENKPDSENNGGSFGNTTGESQSQGNETEPESSSGSEEKGDNTPGDGGTGANTGTEGDGASNTNTGEESTGSLQQGSGTSENAGTQERSEDDEFGEDSSNIDDIFDEDDSIVMGMDDEDPSAEEEVPVSDYKESDPSSEEEPGYEDPSAEETEDYEDPSAEEELPSWYTDDFVQSEYEPVHPETNNATDLENITGEPDINLLWQTMNYDPNATDIPVVKVDGKTITEIHGKPIKPGSELSKKLTQKGWLAKADKYYIVTQSEQAKTAVDKKDAFAVALVIEDEESTYLCYYRSLGSTMSISTTDGKVYNVNDRVRLRNKLLLRHMDVHKIFNFLGSFLRTLFASDTKLLEILDQQQTVKAYHKAVQEYARQLYIRDNRINYANLGDEKAVEKINRQWNLLTSTKVKLSTETQELFDERVRRESAILSGYLSLARKFFSDGSGTIYSNTQIEKELDRLQEARNKVIDAYLDKVDGEYVFPSELLIGRVRPESVSLSNGRINNMRNGVLPIFRPIVPDGANMLEIQSDLEKGNITIGIGKGPRPKRGGANTIVRYGFKTSGEEEVLFPKSGIAGKLYLMVPQLTNGEPVPVMLSEEKFDVQHRTGTNGRTDKVKINSTTKVKLCIDPETKTVDQDSPYTPSAAEVLLYMILGELNLPQNLQTEDVVRLFINSDPKTLLSLQPDATSSDFIIALSAKQLYYGPDVVDQVETTPSGKKIVRKVKQEGSEPMFHIGLPQRDERTITINGQEKQIAKTVYIELKFTKEEILLDEQLRQKIVLAIATQMHWNTDDETFVDSASISASSSALGDIVKYLILEAYSSGKFDGMSNEEIMNQSVSIEGCPQLSFKIGDFYLIEKDDNGGIIQTQITNASVLAWMLKSGRIKTDVSEQIWKDPYIFSSGVVVSEDNSNLKQEPVVDKPISTGNNSGEGNNGVGTGGNNEDTNNEFNDERKESEIVSSINNRYIKSLNLPKTRKEAKKKLKEFIEFLKSEMSFGKFVGFSDIDLNTDEILDIILLENTTRDKLIEYDDDLIDDSTDEEFDDAANRQLKDTVNNFVQKYNSENRDKISDSVIKNTKSFTQMGRQYINAAVVYKDKNGNVKCIVSTISSKDVLNKKRTNPATAQYTIKAATGVFSKTKSVGQFREKQARDWLSDVLGIDPENVYVWDAAINSSVDPDVQGSVDVVVDSITKSLIGTIGLNRQGGASVHYHEAWHYVNLLLHNEKERNMIYKMFVKSHKYLSGATKEEVEEEMAEAFRLWMIQQQDNSLKGIVKRAWNNILDFIVLWNGKRQYKKVFKNIASGKYKKESPSYKNLLHFKKEWQNGAHSIEYYTEGVTEEERLGFDYINQHQLFFDASRAIAKYVISELNIRTNKDLKRINKELKELRKEHKLGGEPYKSKIQQIIESWINDSNTLSDSNKDLLKDVARNLRLVQSAIVSELETFGIKAKIRRFKDVNTNQNNIDEDKLPERGEKDNTATDLEDTFRADNTWDIDELSMSKKDKMSTRVKMFFRQIPVYIDGVKQYDDFGVVKTYDFSEAWNKIMENLWYCESLLKRDKDGWRHDSMMGIIEYLKNSDEFFASLYDLLNQTIQNNGAQLSAMLLRSELYSLINSNKPDVSYLQLSDPNERFIEDDDWTDVIEDSVTIRSNLAADISRQWQMRSGNEDDVARNLPRNWSKELTAHGFTVVRDGKSVVSEKFAEDIRESLKNIKSTLNKKYQDKTFDLLCDDVVKFYNRLAIPLDRRSLNVLITMYTKTGTNVSDKEAFKIIKSWFIQSESKDGDSSTSKKATIPAIAEVLASSVGKDELNYNIFGDKRIRNIDLAFDNYTEGTDVYKLAIAINRVHPSSREFSTVGPNGERIYPISQNSFVSDRLRLLSLHGSDYAKRAMRDSLYAAGSELLLKSSQIPLGNSELQFRLKAFVGIKDRDRKRGADYFGITPLEDYISKLIITEGLNDDSSDNMLVLPTMADKKTWYAIYSKLIMLCHGTVHNVRDSKFLNDAIYDEYAKIKPKDEKALALWQKNALDWFHELEKLADSGNEDSKVIVDNIDAAADEAMSAENISLDRFDDRTISWFYKYVRSEINTLEDYYSRKNIERCVTNSTALLENYHGNLFTTEDGKVRMDFSGNGGRMRYFQDLFMFKDSKSEEKSKEVKKFNLNQRLQYLYELQKKIESGKVTNLDENDPLYPFITQGSFSNKQELDGFELVRLEIKRIKDLYFGNDLFENKEMQEKINALLINAATRELEKIADPESPYHIIKKDATTGLFKQHGIPQLLLIKYLNRLSGKNGVHYNKNNINTADPVLVHNAIVSLIGNYVVNAAISTIEFEKVFSGDPAFYKEKPSAKEKMTQRVLFSDGKIAEETIDVDIVEDTFSDKIKRLGSLLSPGDEQRLDFTEEELAKYPELRVTDYTIMNVEDINALSIFDDLIESSFKTLLLIDHIRLIDKEPFEKVIKKKGLTFELGIKELYHDKKLFKDVYKEYPTIHDAIEKQTEKQIDPYRNINVSDAQVFVRPELYRKIRIGLGQWTETDEKAYRILETSEQSGDMSWMSDEKKYRIVRQLELFPLKMTYFDNDPSLFYRACVPNLNKMAVFPLFKFLATSDTSRKLYKRMNKPQNEIDMIAFKSAAKVGATKRGVKMSKDGVSVKDQVCYIDDAFELDSSRWIDRRRRKNEKGEWEFSDTYGNVHDGKSAKMAPVKIQKLQYLRMLLNTEHHEEDFRNLGTQMFKLAFSNIIEDAYYGDRTGKQLKDEIISTINQLTDLGVLNIRKRFFVDKGNGTYEPNVKEIHSFITQIAENNGIGSSAVNLMRQGFKAVSASSRTVFENAVNNVVNSEVVDIETQGGTAIQQSVFGFVGLGNHEVSDLRGALALNYNDGKELIWNREDGTMEVMLSMNFFRNILPPEMKDKSFKEQRQWLIDNDIIKGKKTTGELSNPEPFGIGYRIPTQGMSSMFGFTVADVFPPTVGDLIVVPREFTAQTGSDFDVDKLFLATFARKNGKILTEDMLSEDNDVAATERKQALVNKLLKDYLTLITDVANYADARASIDVLTSTLRKDFVGRVIRRTDPKYISSFTELLPTFLADRKREFSVGKAGIAPFALNVTNLSLTQISHLTMRYTGEIEEYGFGKLDEVYGRGINKKEKVRISAWLSAMVNAHVDVAKDPYIFDLNINQATYNYANFLIRAGMGMSTFTFLAQDSLKHIANNINNAGGMYGGNLVGGTSEEDIYKKKRRQVIMSEYRKLSYKLDDLLKQDLSERLKKTIASLKTYSDYMSKTHRKKEDEEAPVLDFKRELVFDEEYGKTMILKEKSNDVQDKIDYIEYQLACIRGFQEISPYADNISKLVSASQIDTKKFGNTLADHINFENKILHLFEDGDLWTINEEGFEDNFKGPKGGLDKKAAQQEAIRRYFEDTYLMKKFIYAQQMCRDILKTELFVAQEEFTRVFNDILGEINGTTEIEDAHGLEDGVIRKNGEKGNYMEIYNAELSIDKVEALSKAIDSIMRFNSMFNCAKRINDDLNEDAIDFTCGGDINKVILKFSDILFGTNDIDPLYKRLADFKEKVTKEENADKYWDILDENGEFNNEFLKILVPQSPNKERPVGMISLYESLLDKDSLYEERLISAFSLLLYSSDEETSNLAKDLVFYAYYSNYDNNVLNGFFHLVPQPFREQYDRAMQRTIDDLNSTNEDIRNSASEDMSVSTYDMIDIINRNFWYDDDITPRHYLKNGDSDLRFQYGDIFYGVGMMYNGVDGFPQYICINNKDNNIKNNSYFKVVRKGATLLYRRVGVLMRTSKETGKSYSINVYLPVLKAGLSYRNVHMYEFYANGSTPSVYKSNRLPANFAHDIIKEKLEKLAEEANQIESNKYTIEFVWDAESTPDVYLSTNRQLYEPFVEGTEGDVIDRMIIQPAKEVRDNFYRDPIVMGVNQSVVTLDISTGDFSISFEDEEELLEELERTNKDLDETLEKKKFKKQVKPDQKDKIVQIDPSKTITEQIYNNILDIIRRSDSNKYPRIFINVSDVSGIEITEEDRKQYINEWLGGEASEKTKKALANEKYFDNEVRQWKINTLVKLILDRVLQENVNNVTLISAAYGTAHTEGAKAVQFCKQVYPDVRQGVSGKVYVSARMFRNKSLYNKFRYSMIKTSQTFNPEAVSVVARLISSQIQKQAAAEDKAKELVQKTIEKINNLPSQGGQGNQAEQNKPQPPQNQEINKIDKNNPEDQQNKSCGNGIASFYAGDDFDF